LQLPARIGKGGRLVGSVVRASARSAGRPFQAIGRRFGVRGVTARSL